ARSHFDGAERDAFDAFIGGDEIEAEAAVLKTYDRSSFDKRDTVFEAADPEHVNVEEQKKRNQAILAAYNRKYGKLAGGQDFDEVAKSQDIQSRGDWVSKANDLVDKIPVYSSLIKNPVEKAMGTTHLDYERLMALAHDGEMSATLEA